jgi:hypothetical protein
VRVDRREPCAGVVVDNWTRVVSNTTREQIIVNRPIVTTVVAVTEELRIATALPAAVTPGIWHFVSLLNSHCPTRDVVDQIADFTVEVIAPEYEGK